MRMWICQPLQHSKYRMWARSPRELHGCVTSATRQAFSATRVRVGRGTSFGASPARLALLPPRVPLQVVPWPICCSGQVSVQTVMPPRSNTSSQSDRASHGSGYTRGVRASNLCYVSAGSSPSLGASAPQIVSDYKRVLMTKVMSRVGGCPEPPKSGGASQPALLSHTCTCRVADAHVLSVRVRRPRASPSSKTMFRNWSN